MAEIDDNVPAMSTQHPISDRIACVSLLIFGIEGMIQFIGAVKSGEITYESSFSPSRLTLWRFDRVVKCDVMIQWAAISAPHLHICVVSQLLLDVLDRLDQGKDFRGYIVTSETSVSNFPDYFRKGVGLIATQPIGKPAPSWTKLTVCFLILV